LLAYRRGSFHLALLCFPKDLHLYSLAVLKIQKRRRRRDKHLGHLDDQGVLYSVQNTSLSSSADAHHFESFRPSALPLSRFPFVLICLCFASPSRPLYFVEGQYQTTVQPPFANTLVVGKRLRALAMLNTASVSARAGWRIKQTSD
jgi:hypothetical protein